MWTKLIVILGFAISFSAGLAVGVGRGTSRGGAALSPTTGPGGHPSRGRGMLDSVLNLTPDQQEQMRKIWSETANRGEQDDKRRLFRKERDEGIAKLIRTDDRAAYDGVLAKYTEQTNALEQETRKAYEIAVEKTKGILTVEQRIKYEEILKRNQWDRGGQRPGPGGPQGPGPQGPGGPGPKGPGPMGGEEMPRGGMPPGFSHDDPDHRRGGERATTRPAVEK